MSSLGLWHDPAGLSRRRERYEKSKAFLAQYADHPDVPKWLIKQNRRIMREYETQEERRIAIEKLERQEVYDSLTRKGRMSESWLTRD